MDALIPALQAIRQLAEDRTTGKLTARRNSTELGETGSPRRFQNLDGPLPYDPACVFHLEMMVSLASRGKKHIAETWYVPPRAKLMSGRSSLNISRPFSARRRASVCC